MTLSGSSGAARRHRVWHLAFGCVGLGLVAVSVWVVVGDLAAHEREMQGLRVELAARERDLAQQRLVLQKLVSHRQASAASEVERAAARRALQVEALDRVFERLARLSPAPGEARGRQDEAQRLQRLIECYPYEVQETVKRQRGIEKQCGCAPDDPLCSCF